MKPLNLPRCAALVLATIVLSAAIVHLAAQPTAAAAINNTRGIALDGYDVVAYFVSGRPIQGSAAFAHRWQGVTWHFATADNRDVFAKTPERYAPQFGGYCAYGVSRGYTVDVDPNAWSIVGGRLYLNYSKSVQRTWDKDRASYIQKAETNWPALAAKTAGQEE